MTGLFYAHSGLRYLILLLGVVAVVYYALGLSGRQTAPRAGAVLMTAFVGVLDLQVVLGIALVAMGIYYPALMGHMFVMLAAAVVAHGASAMSRRLNDSGKAARIRLAGVVVALLLIVGGISAIGRGIFQSGAPSL
jgi:hypothetical protein